jgi:histidine triad (HIT) family protein
MEVPSREAYSGELTYAFHDKNPVAPVHVLIVPRQHIVQLGPEHGMVLIEMVEAAYAVAERLGIAEGGYRLVVNVGPNAGAEVAHMHMHVLGGRRLAWPPG